jgi:hypothetical protein
VVRRNMNRRHMTGDHRGGTAGRATLLARAMDEILGTHNGTDHQDAPKNELPEGPRRDFVEELRRYYRAAGRPPLRHVSNLIEGRADLKEITASQETVRRMLRGIVIPTDWNRVNAVFQVFCEIGEIDPVADRWEDSYNSEENNREYLRRLWDAAWKRSRIRRRFRGPPRPIPNPPRPRRDSPAIHGRQTRQAPASVTNRRFS